jgi:hypothetical protein
MFKKISYIIVITLLLASCKTKKNIVDNNTASNDTFTTKVVENYNNYSFNKNTLKASIKAKYKGKSNLPSVNVSLRMEKDKVIWMSISKFINIGKLKITPNRVQFYNKLQNEYFDGDFSLLSDFLGTEVNFNQVQKILLGEAIFDLNEKDYNVKTLQNQYEFTPKKQHKLFDILFLLNAQNFKINKQEIKQEKEQKLLSISYLNYENMDNVNFPKNIFIVAKDKSRTNTVEMIYKNVEFDLDLSFPFKIPSGYKEIKL